jgi:N-acetylneuraminic acid mutarotase
MMWPLLRSRLAPIFGSLQAPRERTFRFRGLDMRTTRSWDAAMMLGVAIAIGAGCSTSSSPIAPPPLTGSLQITVSGLPGGLNPSLHVLGPSGYSKVVTAGGVTALAHLSLGLYTVAAGDVSNGRGAYAAQGDTQQVALTASSPNATATVIYAFGGTWTAQAPMPTQRAALAAGVINETVYAVGGTVCPTQGVCFPTKVVEAYSPSANSWTTEAPMPTARQELAVGVVNDILYAVGGRDSVGTSGNHAVNTVEAYDPSTNSWTTKAPMPTPRVGLEVGVVNGILYAIGGLDSVVRVTAVEAYDPSTNTWTTKAPMPANSDVQAAGVVNNILYAVDADGTLYVYDPVANAWTTKASLPVLRDGLAGAVVNGVFYAVGGNNNGLGYLNAIEGYNPATNSWTDEASMPTPRELLAAAVVNGVLYAIGGFQCAIGNNNQCEVPSNAVQAFTP